MKNIKYSIDTLVRKPFFFMIVVIQFSITMLFFNLSVMGIMTAKETTNRINSIFENKQFYNIKDKTNEEKLFDDIFTQSDSLERLKQFYDFLVNNDEFDFIEYESFKIPLKDVQLNDNFFHSKEHRFLNNEKGKFSLIKSFSVGDKFFKHLPFEVESGEKFNSTDFENSDITKIILGNGFKKYYDIGDEIEYYDYEKKEIKKLKVKAFLKKGYYFLDGGSGLIDIDYYMILPKKAIDISSEIAMKKIDNSINQSIISTQNVENTFKLIQSKSRELNLYTSLEEDSLNNHGQILRDIIYMNINKVLPVGISILLFSMISIIVSLLGVIKKSRKEFGVHLLSGATMKDLSLRILWVAIFYIGISAVLASIITNKMKNTIFPDLFQVKVYGYTAILAIVIILIISILPIKQLYKTEICDIIRRKE